MTKKQEAPYQISLDIPFKPIKGKSSSTEEHPSSTLPPVSGSGKEDALTSSQSDDVPFAPLSSATPTPRLKATQISLLDNWGGEQSDSDPDPGLSLTIPHSASYSSQTPDREGQQADPIPLPIVRQPTSVIPEPYLLPTGTVISSPGGHFSYRILGACCRLFDRDELPWPCCRIQWRSKEPSWRRIGKRFVPDLATKRFPSYIVEILDHEYSRDPFVLTLYWLKFPSDIQNWWYTKYVPTSSPEA